MGCHTSCSCSICSIRREREGRASAPPSFRPKVGDVITTPNLYFSDFGPPPVRRVVFVGEAQFVYTRSDQPGSLNVDSMTSRLGWQVVEEKAKPGQMYQANSGPMFLYVGLTNGRLVALGTINVLYPTQYKLGELDVREVNS